MTAAASTASLEQPVPSREPPERGSPERKRRRWPLLLPLLWLLPFGYLLGTPQQIVLDQGLSLDRATLPAALGPGEVLSLKVHLRASQPLTAPYHFFIHLSSSNAGLSGCKSSFDRAPAAPATTWQAGQEVVLSANIPIPVACTSGAVLAHVGLYLPSTGQRLPVLVPAAPDQRIFVGAVEVEARAADTSAVSRPASSLLRAQRMASLRPWSSWLLALFASSLATVLLAGTRRTTARVSATALRSPAEPSAATQSSQRWRHLSQAALALPVLAFLLGVLVVLEWIKDDAYISFRYAHNLVEGQGLVFNVGERVEGITNFLWTLLLAPFELLGLDLFQVCEILGSGLGIACVVLTARTTAWLGGQRRDLSMLWGATWLATSSSFVLYAKSGLEQPLAAMLPLLGAFVLLRARARRSAPSGARAENRSEGGSEREAERSYLRAGLLLGAACLTRPELHMLAGLIALPILYDCARARRLDRATLRYVAGGLAVTIPAHTFRFFYYGSLIPNTFYVKTGSGSASWLHGLHTLSDMFSFNSTGVLLVLAPLAFINRSWLIEKTAFALIALAFLVYYAKVGVDEMQWHRLYIPALPFLCVLAALGVQNLTDRIRQLLSDSSAVGAVLSGVAWAGVLMLAYQNFEYTYDQQHGFNGHGDLAGTFHPDMGKFLVRHERPGGLVAFQDMGSTPYHAPDLSFLDFFGLVDETVAHARHDYGLHTFISGDPLVQEKYDADMRDYFFRRNPEWSIMTIYPPRDAMGSMQQLYNKDPTGGSFGNLFRNNPMQFRLWDDPRFRQRYVPVRTWQRSVGYYLSVFRRRDLWQQTPREVVLDAPPPQATSVVTRFANGLELLGSEITPETLERHEAFMTSWWRLPGPLAKDLMFFVHVTKPGFQSPADHIPGDWMYPADRWQAGQILEDRILFQVPPELMLEGEYDVFIGVYHRTTGERIAIASGQNAGSNRVHLGKLQVKPLQPLLHHLIPPTRVDEMRVHRDRIVDPQRVPGT